MGPVGITPATRALGTGTLNLLASTSKGDGRPARSGLAGSPRGTGPDLCRHDRRTRGLVGTLSCFVSSSDRACHVGAYAGARRFHDSGVNDPGGTLRACPF